MVVKNAQHSLGAQCGQGFEGSVPASHASVNGHAVGIWIEPLKLHGNARTGQPLIAEGSPPTGKPQHSADVNQGK